MSREVAHVDALGGVEFRLSVGEVVAGEPVAACMRVSDPKAWFAGFELARGCVVLVSFSGRTDPAVHPDIWYVADEIAFIAGDDESLRWVVADWVQLRPQPRDKASTSAAGFLSALGSRVRISVQRQPDPYDSPIEPSWSVTLDASPAPPVIERERAWLASRGVLRLMRARGSRWVEEPNRSAALEEFLKEFPQATHAARARAALACLGLEHGRLTPDQASAQLESIARSASGEDVRVVANQLALVNITHRKDPDALERTLDEFFRPPLSPWWERQVTSFRRSVRTMRRSPRGR